MRQEWTKCKHLYFYFDHHAYGFMNIRLQTWFPYHIQVAMNGREWLRRDLEKKDIGFERWLLIVVNWVGPRFVISREGVRPN